MTPLRIDLPYLMEDHDRHGRHRLFVRYRRRKVRIHEIPGTDAFLIAYKAALAALRDGAAIPTPARSAKAPLPASLGALAAGYFGSPEFRALDRTSQRTRRQVIESCLQEPLTPGGGLVMRDCPFKRVDATHVLMLRDRRADKPGAANNRLKYLSAMFGWAIEAKRFGLGANPVRDVKPIGYVSGGYYTWTIDDVRRYEARHPVGTKARLGFALMLYLGARRGDMIRLGPANMKDGWMVYVPRKTAYRRVDPSHKPILPALAEIIRATPTGMKTFLVTRHGKPYSSNGIGNTVRTWCDQAGLPECTAHGLKKIAAVLCAENNATDRQMMALFDWMNEKQATIYTQAASRRRLAGEAARLLGGALDGEPTVPHQVGKPLISL